MIFYGVVSEYYDNGKATAWITNHATPEEVDTLPEPHMKSLEDKDVYFDYFLDKAEAIQVCDEIKNC